MQPYQDHLAFLKKLLILQTEMNTSRFKIEFDRNYLPLCMYALRLLNVKEEAEDAVQQSFVAVWEILESGKEIANMKSYLYKSVHNRCMCHLRKLHTEYTECLDNIDDEVSEEDIDTSERDALLWDAIDRLPVKCREIFLLSKRDGLSHKEISEKLNISIKTIENQMTKAFSRLRDSLQPNDRKIFFLPFL